MSDPSSDTYETAASELSELALVGLMTVETFTVLSRLLALRSPLSARTKSDLTLLAGSLNSLPKLDTQEDWLGLSSISAEVRHAVTSNTPRSHSGCWCSCSRKRDTNNVVHPE